MEDEGHWLDRVVDILLANTGDLDELARIAGEDPKVMYAGMKRPEFRDEPEVTAEVEPPESSIEGLFVWLDEDLDIVRHALEEQLYRRSPQLLASLRLNRPGPFVVYCEDTFFDRYRRPDLSSAVSLIVRSGKEGRRTMVADLAPPPVIELPAQQSILSKGGARTIAQDILCLASAMATAGRFELPKRSTFIRSGARKKDDYNAGWASVFEQLLRQGADWHNSVTFIDAHPEGRDATPSFSMFERQGARPKLVLISPFGEGASVLASGLFPYDDRPSVPWRLLDSAEELCNSLGWGSQSDEKGANAFIIGNSQVSFRIWAPWKSGNNEKIPEFSSDRNLVLLELSLDATTSRITARSDITKHLLISIRDLADFPPSARSIWPIVGAQIARIAFGYPSKARTAYFKMVFHAILEQPHIEYGSPKYEIFERCLHADYIICQSLRDGVDTLTASFSVNWVKSNEVATLEIQFNSDMASLVEYYGEQPMFNRQSRHEID